MRDQRITTWAKVLVNYSMNVQSGQTLFLVGDAGALPLIEACYEELIQKGVKVECMLYHKPLQEFLLQHGTDEQLLFAPQARLKAVTAYDHQLYIGANTNSKMLSRIPPKRQSLATQGTRPILDMMLGRAAEETFHWCLTMFPTPAQAQDAEMGTQQYEEFVLNAGFLNDPDPVASWKKLSQLQDSLIQYLDTKKELHFQNKDGTDLRVNIDGMKWKNCDGKINFPDGEVFTGPNLKAANGGINGIVRYSMPTIYKNVEVHGVELHFKNGQVVEAHASKNEAFLHEMINLDQGSKYVGEIALGTNYRITECTKDILFDEKIGGTFHLALGKGYPETGNCNESALHWDLIFDLRQGGTIHADGELLSKDGRFIQYDFV